MSLIHECNKNNRKDTKRNEFAWHCKILTNRLWFICLFVNDKNLTKNYDDFRARKVRRIGQTIYYGKSFKRLTHYCGEYETGITMYIVLRKHFFSNMKAVMTKFSHNPHSTISKDETFLLVILKQYTF